MAQIHPSYASLYLVLKIFITELGFFSVASYLQYDGSCCVSMVTDKCVTRGVFPVENKRTSQKSDMNKILQKKFNILIQDITQESVP